MSLFNRNKPRSPADISTDIMKPDSDAMLGLGKLFFSGKLRARMYGRLAAPVSAGINIEKAVSDLYQRAAFKSQTETEAIVLRHLLYTLTHGGSISQGLGYFIPVNEQLLLRSGEDSGDIARAMREAAKIINDMREVNMVVYGAMTKPLILLSMLFVVLFVISANVLPNIAAILPMDRWTGGAAKLAAVANWVNSPKFPASLAVACALIYLAFFMRERWIGPGRVTADKLPPYIFYRIQQGASWMKTLSAMLQSGRSIRDCLEELHGIASQSKNRYIASRTLAIIRESEAGAESIGIAMERTLLGFPDREVIADLVMRSTLPDFDQQISNVAESWTKDSLETLKALSKVVMGTSVLVLGVAIALLILGVLSLNAQMGAAMQSM